jgi:lipopolysaccharide biosynthesis regulator YciM
MTERAVTDLTKIRQMLAARVVVNPENVCPECGRPKTAGCKRCQFCATEGVRK